MRAITAQKTKLNTPTVVAVNYVYEQDPVSTIYTEVQHIHDLGFRLIRITLEYDRLNPESSRRTGAFYAAAQRFNMNVALATQNHQDLEIIRDYLNRWAKYASYIQILNEPESSTSWDVGALFTDDEIITRFQEPYA